MKKIILALACCSVLASCVKEEDKKPIDVSKTTFLMDGHWQLKVFTWLPDITDSTATPVDIYTPIPGCEKDNFFVFNTTSRVSLYEGSSKCDVNAPDSIVYGYYLTNNDKRLEIYTNPDDANHETLLAGDMTYPTIDSFVLTYLAPNPQDSTKTSRYVRKYAKFN
jgi:hypothetical protein